MDSTNTTSAFTKNPLRIALIGYGKMGKAIEEIAVKRGHLIGLKIDINSLNDFIDSNDLYFRVVSTSDDYIIFF